MATEFGDRKELFALSAPRGTLWAYFTPTRAAAFVAMIFIAAQMREGDVFQRPEKLDAHALPGLFVLDTQLFGSLNYFRTLEAYVLSMLAQEIVENHFAQTITGSAMRHT
jgi:hypothetical protein